MFSGLFSLYWPQMGNWLLQNTKPDGVWLTQDHHITVPGFYMGRPIQASYTGKWIHTTLLIHAISLFRRLALVSWLQLL